MIGVLTEYHDFDLMEWCLPESIENEIARRITHTSLVLVANELYQAGEIWFVKLCGE